MSVDLITTIVVAALAGRTGKVVAAPLEGVADHVKNRIRARLDTTLTKATAKSRGAPLRANDRIAAKVLNEMAWTDDELIADYLGGVLAASGPDNDAGAPIVAQIGRLSGLQLRFQYVVYRELRRLWPDCPMNLYQSIDADRAGIRIPLADLVAAFGEDSIRHLRSAIPVLVREGLLAATYQMKAEDPERPVETFAAQVRPSGLGAELFLWGHGAPSIDAALLFDRSVEWEILTEVPTSPSASLITPPTE